MALAIDVMHGRGLSTEMRTQLQPKKTKVRPYKPLIWQQQALYALYTTNKMERFSFKSQ